MRALAFLLLFLPGAVWAQIQVEKAWTRATPPGAKVAAGYLVLRNSAATADRLLSVSSPAAARVEAHITTQDGDISRMREVNGYAIPAGGRLELKPGAGHLMFVELKAPFRQGEKVAATLRFQHAGEMKVEFEVERLGAADHGAMKMN